MVSIRELRTHIREINNNIQWGDSAVNELQIYSEHILKLFIETVITEIENDSGRMRVTPLHVRSAFAICFNEIGEENNE
tara:strand:+ start:8194 stop:8430 length:237 start_codon:yes stop_codon:yes gene_type:complete